MKGNPVHRPVGRGFPTEKQTMEIIRKRYDLQVTNNGREYREVRDLDKDTTRIRGILLVSDRDDLLFHRATAGINIGGREVFPGDYHARLLMSGLAVAPQQRYFPLDLEPGNFKLSVTLSDFDNPVASFSPYRVSVYLELEKPYA